MGPTIYIKIFLPSPPLSLSSLLPLPIFFFFVCGRQQPPSHHHRKKTHHKSMHNNEEESPEASSSSRTRLRTRPDPFSIACRCFSVVTCLAALLCVAINILSYVRSFKNGSDVSCVFLGNFYFFLCGFCSSLFFLWVLGFRWYFSVLCSVDSFYCGCG